MTGNGWCQVAVGNPVRSKSAGIIVTHIVWHVNSALRMWRHATPPDLQQYFDASNWADKTAMKTTGSNVVIGETHLHHPPTVGDNVKYSTNSAKRKIGDAATGNFCDVDGDPGPSRGGVGQTPYTNGTFGKEPDDGAWNNGKTAVFPMEHA